MLFEGRMRKNYMKHEETAEHEKEVEGRGEWTKESLSREKEPGKTNK